MTSEAMRDDLTRRIENAVNDLKNEWMASGNEADSFTVEVAQTATGVSVSLVVLVGAESSNKKADGDTPLSKKKI
ncbi:MAG: hypothetical protein SFZ02_19205 [bacterium]|nr:hypothetical protein [bacterium]